MIHAGSQVGTLDGDPGKALLRETFTFGPLAEGEALVEPIIGSWEANIDHALARWPIDICSTRGEDAAILGNLGVVRVLAVRPGPESPPVRAGDLCLLMPFGKLDRHGYAELVHGYDCPNTLGLLAKRSKMSARLLLPIPTDTEFSLAQWATYGRYFTAWDNWHRALGCWRTQVPDDDPADHLVFGWGGGVSLAQLTLAKRDGFRVAMTASSDERLAFLDRQGIVGIDRRRFPHLAVPQRRGGANSESPLAHKESMAEFLRVIGELSDGYGVSIFVDNIGEPLYKATTNSLARAGVVTACGWKAGMRISHLRAGECINRHIQVNTHVWRFSESAAIRDFQQSAGWIAPVDSTVVYDFDQVPRLARDYARGSISPYFPLYSINPV